MHLGSRRSQSSNNSDLTTPSALASAAVPYHFFSSSPTHSISGRSDVTQPSASSHTTMDSHPTHDAPSESAADSCEYDPDTWFAQFHDDDDADCESHVLPTMEQLDLAANVPVYDADGVSRPFKSLYTGSEHIGQRQLVIFIRHFYCFGCQSYLQKLTETITPSAYFSLPTPTTITVIGCGLPHLIPRYTTATTCPFRVYADPSRKLYKALGMRQTFAYGSRPDYMSKNSAWEMTVKSLMPAVKAKRRDKLAGGNLMQVGGEFLFEEGEAVWCRRMMNYRDHTEMKILKRVLEMDEEVPVVQEAMTAVSVKAGNSGRVSSARAVQGPEPSVHRENGSRNGIGAGGQAAKGLKLVWDGTGVQAHLQRESRIPDEAERMNALSPIPSYYGASELDAYESR